MKPKARPHRRLENKETGAIGLELTEGEYSGIIFSYGKVAFDENEQKDNLKVHFEYEILDGEDLIKDKKVFEQELGDFLIELILEEADNNNLIFTGGTDENREDNTVESDPQ